MILANGHSKWKHGQTDLYGAEQRLERIRKRPHDSTDVWIMIWLSTLSMDARQVTYLKKICTEFLRLVSRWLACNVICVSFTLFCRKSCGRLWFTKIFCYNNFYLVLNLIAEYTIYCDYLHFMQMLLNETCILKQTSYSKCTDFRQDYPNYYQQNRDLYTWSWLQLYFELNYCKQCC